MLLAYIRASSLEQFKQQNVLSQTKNPVNANILKIYLARNLKADVNIYERRHAPGL